MEKSWCKNQMKNRDMEQGKQLPLPPIGDLVIGVLATQVQTKIGTHVDIYMHIFIFGEWQDVCELSSVRFTALFEILGAADMISL